jgi:hypothetical protein
VGGQDEADRCHDGSQHRRVSGNQPRPDDRGAGALPWRGSATRDSR